MRGTPRTARKGRIVVAGLVVAVAALVALDTAPAAVDPLGAGRSAIAAVSTCVETTVTALAEADSWVDENSPFATKGGDAILNIDGGSLNVDTGVASGRARALIRFQLPQAIPEGCVLSATLSLYSTEESAGAKAEVVRLASAWSESTVSWSNQPRRRSEPGVARWSQDGYMHWNVTAQVEAMMAAGNHGFLLRDAAEGSEAAAAATGSTAGRKARIQRSW